MEILQSLLTSLKPAVVYFSHNKNYIYHLPSNVIFGRGYMHFFIMSKFYNARCLWLTCSWMSTQTRNNCKCIKQILLIRTWKYWWTVFTSLGMVSFCIYTMKKYIRSVPFSLRRYHQDLQTNFIANHLCKLFFFHLYSYAFSFIFYLYFHYMPFYGHIILVSSLFT